MLSEGIEIVLVDTSHSGNIGAVARAMKNMAISRLCLVNPADFPSHEAERRASGATDVLDKARIVPSLDEAIADSHFVVGASARSRAIPWPLMNPRDCARMVLQKLARNSSGKARTVSIVFGRESSGLTNDELQRCHYHVNIPANPEYASLNLAMAVQVICYELRMAALLSQSDGQLSAIHSPGDDEWDEDPASVSDLEGYLVHLEEALTIIGFHDPKKPRMLMTRLRRLYQRAQLDKMEVNILRGMLKATIQASQKNR